MYRVAMIIFVAIIFASLPCLLGSNPQISYSPAGIDFGSLFVKVAHVAPGQSNPVPLALNEMTERKTINSIAVKENRVLIGTQASKWFLNKPEFAFRWINLLLGAQDSPKKEVNGPTDENGRFLIESSSFENHVHPEFICGLFLHKLMRQAERDTKKSLREVVISVPPYFDLIQRHSVIQVAKLANLHVLSLINDISAAGLYYATFIASKQQEDSKKFALVDLGASHSAAAVFSFDPEFKKDGINFLKIQLLRVSSPINQGGKELDQALSSLIIEKIMKSNTKFSLADLKINNRILAESNRVKHVLSANADARVNLDDLTDDFSFSCVITRSEFEEKINEWESIPVKMVEEVFSSMNMSPDNVSAIIPIGGNSRVPLVRSALENKYGNKVKFILNADETVAQGTAWYSAMLSNFRIKKILFEDLIQHNIYLEYLKDGSPTRITVFDKNSAAGHEKIISFKNLNNFDGTIYLDETPVYNLSSLVKIDDVLKSKGIEDANYKIKLWIKADNSGLISIPRSPEVIYEYLKVPSTELGTNSTDSATVAPPSDMTVSRNETSSTVENPEMGKNSTTLETVPVTVSESFELKIKIQNLVPTLPESLLQSYTQQIASIQRKEDHEKLVSQTINDLESVYYRTKNDFEANKEFITDEEVLELENNLNIAKMFSDGEKNNYEEAKKALNGLISIENIIAERQENLIKLKSLKEEVLGLLQSLDNVLFDKADEIKNFLAQPAEDVKMLDENIEKALQYKASIEVEINAKNQKEEVIADESIKSNIDEEERVEL